MPIVKYATATRAFEAARSHASARGKGGRRVYAAQHYMCGSWIQTHPASPALILAHLLADLLGQPEVDQHRRPLQRPAEAVVALHDHLMVRMNRVIQIW